MEDTRQYITEEDRQNLISTHSNMYIIKELHIFENGNYEQLNHYITFSDEKPIEVRVQEQTDNQLTIMEALADLYTALPQSTV